MAPFILRPASALVAVAMGALALRRAWMIVAAMLPRRSPQASPAALPSIALIVPAVDEEDQLPATLAALERLDYPAERLSVILVDDGSSDRSAELMADWASNREGANALSLGRRAGKGEALNRALAAASDTDLVVVCDADIRPRPQLLRTLAAEFGDPSVGAAAAFVVPANPDEGIVAGYGALESWVNQLIACAAWDRIGVGPAANGCVAYRSEALTSVGGFDGAGPGEDVRVASTLSAGGWTARFNDEAIADGEVVSTLPAYLRQHLRWSRNLLTASGARPPDDGPRRDDATPAARFRALERRVHSAGYADRVVLAAAFALAAAGRLPRALPGAYVAILAADVASAVVKAGRPAEVPRYLAVASVFSLVDVVASAVAIAAHVGSPSQRWPGTQPNSD